MEVFPGVSMEAKVGAGKPCLTGTTVDVAWVLAELAGGRTIESLCSERGLEVAQARAALGYAAHVISRVVPLVAAVLPPEGDIALAPTPPPRHRRRTKPRGAEVASQAADERRARTRLVAAYTDLKKRRVTVAYGPAARSGAMYDATSDHLRARTFWVGRLNVFVNGVSTVELEAELDDWMLDVLGEMAREWEAEQLDADELADVIPDFLESVERQAEDSTDVDVAEDAAF